MTVAAAYARLRSHSSCPPIVFRLPDDTGDPVVIAYVTDEGQMAFGIGINLDEWDYRPGEALALAQWITDTFA